MTKGIDVSVHQGDIDWKKVKSDGVEFAILRAGYGWALSQKDAQFEKNYAGCKANGIPVGAYTPEERKQRRALNLFFSIVIFAIIWVSILLAAAIVALLIRFGVYPYHEVA
ncbi:MAG: hypothetical protein E7631_07375, partial [Ruminococcaceae bacterium]|nr:hypothetical protein [Oscillospiraceae bacterium]